MNLGVLILSYDVANQAQVYKGGSSMPGCKLICRISRIQSTNTTCITQKKKQKKKQFKLMLFLTKEKNTKRELSDCWASEMNFDLLGCSVFDQRSVFCALFVG